MTAPLAVRLRFDPLTPIAVVAVGDVALRLARRLLLLPDDALARLCGVAAPGVLAVSGPEPDLPWVNGVQYLGRDARAPTLLLPTAVVPAAPLQLMERALVAGSGGAPAPLAVLLDPLRVIPLGGARPIERARLCAWVETGS